ncbi:acyltransferase [Colletotrichum kahawae]|uniref:Acyltransferase n=1 Tax=Colletotrichum kahawae TaxID=34407 RepID=A0AAD9YB14_COLKA|nr:acyltransferase [Colletotrichum kahawae]
MEDNNPPAWKKLAILVQQVPRRMGRASASFLRPRRKSSSASQPRRRSSTVSNMRFVNPFVEGQDASPWSRSSLENGCYRDFKKNERPILVSIRSARSSVSSFFSDDHNDGVSRPRRNGYLMSILCMILPSFMFSPTKNLTTDSRRSSTSQVYDSTAYLDGLRGLASFIIYISHYSHLWYPELGQGYGSSDDGSIVWQKSIVRILHSGRSAVTILFVISGYVLSIRALTMIYKHKDENLLWNIASSALRRPIRLYAPVAVSTAIIAIMVHFGFYIRDPTSAPAPPVLDTFASQMQHWFGDFIGLMNPFKHVAHQDDAGVMAYNGHLWTVHVATKGSFLVLVILVASSLVHKSIRATGTMLLTGWLVHLGDWDKALFPAGLLLAELSLAAPPNALHDVLPRCNTSTSRRAFAYLRGSFRHVWTIALFVCSLHLMSNPDTGAASIPGFQWLSSHVLPCYHGSDAQVQLHWNAIGSILFIIALMYSPQTNIRRFFAGLLGGFRTRSPWHKNTIVLHTSEKEKLEEESAPTTTYDQGEPLLQRLFTTGIAQYLGRISYSLYLWHGFVNHAVGARWLVPANAALMKTHSLASAPLENLPLKMTGSMFEKAWSAYAFSFWESFILNTLVLLWVSDMFNRVVDVPTVRIGRWLGDRCFKKL